MALDENALQSAIEHEEVKMSFSPTPKNKKTSVYNPFALSPIKVERKSFTCDQKDETYMEFSAEKKRRDELVSQSLQGSPN